MPLLKCISLSDGSVVSPPPASVVCLGNFDGVHLAHRALMQEALRLRKKSFPDAVCGVFCFSNPSSDYLSSAQPAHLSTLEQKAEIFAKIGMEYLFLAHFPDVQALTPAVFVKEILQNECHCVAAVCGFNYRFGKSGGGTPETLQKLLDAPVSVQNEICLNGKTVSSTEIRRLLTNGQAEDAATLLTRPYSFTAEVVHGKSLGHTIGVPTVNQYFPQKMLIPRHGVYITDCKIDGKIYRGVSNVGVHPTVDNDARVNCDTHLLDLSQDLYGKRIQICFLKFLRPEKKFDSLDALCKQLQADIRAAKSYLS